LNKAYSFVSHSIGAEKTWGEGLLGSGTKTELDSRRGMVAFIRQDIVGVINE